MGAHPGITAFRRFGSLNAPNLLYLQTELIDLQNKLQKQAKVDSASGHLEPSIYHRDWQTLSEPVNTEGESSAQWHIMLKAREKLKEYNQAICLQDMIASFGPPSEQDFKSLQKWMKDPQMGNIYLLGPDSDVWNSFDTSELVCLKPGRTDSLVMQFLKNRLVLLYHRLIGHHFKKPDGSDIHKHTVYYSPDGVIRLSMLLGTVLASLLPIGSIVLLYSLSDMKIRLIMIGLFTAVFSLGLGVFTNGRMVEVFSATAAHVLHSKFAAVQVVFVSGTS
ncbi:hypothetical protein F5B22DRAFT_661812 [Xylaria bambusicola]|uniref:uncharacterized protein n=1 Tax=Xylaria bambusicola TaxID=326684 RepID=UPI0020072D38|nr:uncharacterized protein F5B22DRAFT_661812 [Xylaria bambusicola]KAI0505167.1 hypothetical protein F5B22DRAFT_661812 [Xylaria bambusicola]